MGAALPIQASLFDGDLDAPALIVPTDAPFNLSAVPEYNLDTDAKVARAMGALTAVMSSGKPLCVAYSGGKDSTCALSLVLAAASDMKASGRPVPRIVVTHANTGIENPAFQTVVESEIGRIRAFAAEHGLPVTVDVASPSLNDSWAVRIIGGRALPTFPNSPTRDCSVNWKIQPQQRQRRATMDDLSMVGSRPVVVIGTRFEESPSRARRMLARGETDAAVWEQETRDADGRLTGLEDMLSPVAFWSQEDVWTYLSDLGTGRRPSYTDAREVWEAYRDGGGTSCAVVSDDAMRAGAKACGARFGCALCVAVGRDKSLEAMVEADPKYEYMRNLNRLQRFLANTQYDLSRRLWLGRSINDQGYVAVRPDAYGPSMQRELLAYALTIDMDEERASRRLGVAPRFRLVSEEQLVAIDAVWNLQGYHGRPFEAIRIWKDVVVDGNRRLPPQVDPSTFPKAMPAPRWLFVGKEWDEGLPGPNRTYSGLRDLVLEMTGAHETGGCIGLRTLADGRQVMDMNSSDMFSVDRDGVMDFLQFEVLMSDLLDDHGNGRDPTEGYRYYARMGFLSVNTRHLGTVDDMMRRTAWKRRNGAMEWTTEELLSRSVSDAEMKRGIREPASPDAWKGATAPRVRREARAMDAGPSM